MACRRCPGSPLPMTRTRQANGDHTNGQPKSCTAMTKPTFVNSMCQQQSKKADNEDLRSNFHFSPQKTDNIISKHFNNIPPSPNCRSFRRTTNKLSLTSIFCGPISASETKNRLSSTDVFQRKSTALLAKLSGRKSLSVGFRNLPVSSATGNCNRHSCHSAKPGTHSSENKNTSAPKPLEIKVSLTATTKKISSEIYDSPPASTEDVIDVNNLEANGSPAQSTNIASEEPDNMSIILATNSNISAETNSSPITSTTRSIISAETNSSPITPTADKMIANNINALPLPTLDKEMSTNRQTWSASGPESHGRARPSPHKKVDNPGQVSHFQTLPTIYAEHAQVTSAGTGRPNDNSEFSHRFTPHWEHNSRNSSSPSTFRYNFQRPVYSQNVRRKDILFGDIIGNGGFGKVYKGSIHGRQVAIKVVQKRRGSGIHREILQAERLAYSLNLRHENIVNILALNLCDGLRGDALIVMELASPQTLQSILDDHTRPVTQSQRLQFSLQISEALSYLHANEVAHLDVKPRNVLLTSDNTCKLADFGSLTRVQKEGPKEDTEYTQLLGTLPYRAPELMKGCYPSTKADIFSLGVTYWQMVTREVPHNGANPHWLIYQVTKNNKRPDNHDPGSDTIEVKYRDLYTCCWGAEPIIRPNAHVISNLLRSMLQCVYEETITDVINRNN